METKTKYIVIGLSVLAATGIGYYIFLKVKEDQLNKLITSSPDAEIKIDNVDTNGIVIPTDVSNEPELPPPAASFGETGTLVEDDWDNEGGYVYLFSDGSRDFYISDGTYIGTIDVNGRLSF
jgi:hypothetical protein